MLRLSQIPQRPRPKITSDLYVAKVAKLSIRFWPMVDLSHVFNRFASENDLSAVALVAPSTKTIVTCLKTLVIRLPHSVSDV